MTTRELLLSHLDGAQELQACATQLLRDRRSPAAEVALDFVRESSSRCTGLLIAELRDDWLGYRVDKTLSCEGLRVLAWFDERAAMTFVKWLINRKVKRLQAALDVLDGDARRLVQQLIVSYATARMIVGSFLRWTKRERLSHQRTARGGSRCELNRPVGYRQWQERRALPAQARWCERLGLQRLLRAARRRSGRFRRD